MGLLERRTHQSFWVHRRVESHKQLSGAQGQSGNAGCEVSTGGVKMANSPFRVSAIATSIFFVVFCFVLPSAIGAQGGATGAITATVLDRSGGFVPNAAVQVIDERTSQVVRSLVTGANGNFTVTLLPPGTYAVIVSAQGFG